MGVAVATGTRLAGGVACAGGEILGGKTAFTLLPLLDVDRGLGDRGAEVGLEEWCGHSLVGSEERRELGRMGEGLSAGGGLPPTKLLL